MITYKEFINEGNLFGLNNDNSIKKEYVNEIKNMIWKVLDNYKVAFLAKIAKVQSLMMKQILDSLDLNKIKLKNYKVKNKTLEINYYFPDFPIIVKAMLLKNRLIEDIEDILDNLMTEIEEKYVCKATYTMTNKGEENEYLINFIISDLNDSTVALNKDFDVFSDLDENVNEGNVFNKPRRK